MNIKPVQHKFALKAPKATGYTVEVSPTTLYGWFEHIKLGDHRSGRLWFARLPGGEMELSDADGTACLPVAVAKALANMGILVDDTYCANDETFPVNETAKAAEIARFNKSEGNF